MRQVSTDLAAAITARERTVRVRLSCDWDGDGHGVPGSVDDLSGQASTVKIGSVLQGTLPDQVNVVEGTGAATIDVDLAKGSTADELLQAVRYFSPSSPGPLAGKPRLNRDLRCDVEFLTASGWRGVPLLRGVSRGMPVRVADRKARLQGLDYRAKLRTPVTLPSAIADAYQDPSMPFPVKPGLEGTWVISYVLAQCGFPMAPPPRAGCRLYVPFHGSAIPFVQKPFNGSPSSGFAIFTTPRAIRYVPGPFLLATEAVTSGSDDVEVHVTAAPGTALWGSDGRAAGRIEIWVRYTGLEPGDPFSVDLFSNSIGPANADVQFRLWGATRQLQVIITNGGTTRTVTGPTVAADGGWHFAGVHFDDLAGTAVFCLDGILTTVGFTTTPANNAVVDTDFQGNINALGSVAEWQVTTGIVASTPFQPTTWPTPAVVDRSQLKLDGIVSPGPTEGWAILQELAAAEQGAVWLDPDGRPQYAIRGRLVSAAAQTPQRTVDAATDLFDLAYDYHLDKIANVVTAPYQLITFSRQVSAWQLSQVVQVPAGSSVTIEATFSPLSTRQRSITGTANTAANGSGTEYSVFWIYNGTPFGAVYAVPVFVSDAAAIITVTNTLGVPVWLVNNTGAANLTLIGDTATQAEGADPPVVINAESRTQYGDQPLALASNRWVQQRAIAWGLAVATAGDLSQPQPVFTNLPIPGDPRLEFFDRLTVRDPSNTGLGLDVWYVGGEHTIDATGHYVQQLACRPARNRYLAGIGAPGVDLVG